MDESESEAGEARGQDIHPTAACCDQLSGTHPLISFLLI